MILQKTGEAKGASFYESEGQDKKYQVRQVDRQYSGTVKKPVYYLERIGAGKPEYISGMFRTKREGFYSLDIKDKTTGIRSMFDAIFTEGGERLELKPKVKKG